MADVDGQAAAGTAAAPAAPAPYGISPYVARAVARIQEHFKQSAPDQRAKGEAFVVGVFGEWGSGKSTVLNAIGAAFDNTPAPGAADAGITTTARAEVTLKVEFNAWRFEREEHLLIPLLKTIQRTLDAYLESLREMERTRPATDAAQSSGTSGWRWWTRRFATDAANKLTDRETWTWLADRAQLLGACTIALTRMVKLKAGIPGLGEVELNPAEALKAAQEQIDRAARLTSDKPP
jgi:hypothetical protein